MSLEYDEYLKEHIQNVNSGLRWLIDNLDLRKLGIDAATADFAIKACSEHDSSKISPEEYFAYDKYFYGNNRSHDVVKSFDYAWLHHQNRNQHHWQYWVLINDDDGVNRALEMPFSCVLEMIADWWSFSWKSGNLEEIFDWYDSHKEKMLLHIKTRKLVEDILEAMKEKLNTRED